MWEQRNAELAVITPSNGKYISQFLEAFGPYPFPFYGDPKREAYKALGHVTMPKVKLLAMAAAGGITGKIKNFFPKEEKQRAFVTKSMKTQDVYIQGGTWIFDKNGELYWSHIDDAPDKHASIEEIKNKLEEM